jgi:hypothetical protein
MKEDAIDTMEGFARPWLALTVAFALHIAAGVDRGWSFNSPTPLDRGSARSSGTPRPA